tara:strand:- start:87149 stop:89254 length:2106 start_codon:yes stop_codon:yes gene_type:complete
MYFSDFFNISNDLLASENVFDISLVSDLPLFIDPFLIFDSKKSEYQQLHQDIVRYVSFVRNKVIAGTISEFQEREWLHFSEIPNNWLGYSVGSNAGRGLGSTFSNGAMVGLQGPLSDFGDENYSKGSHFERLFLFSKGAGKDALSDFITNLCHGFLLDFTEKFTKRHLAADQCLEFNVRRAKFDFRKERWVNKEFILPVFKSQYVLLTPVDLLTQSVPWINRMDLFAKFGGMLEAINDTQLRQNVNSLISQMLAPPPDFPKEKEFQPAKKDVRSAYERALELYPELANCYIALKEDDGNEAVTQSRKRVSRADEFYRARVVEFLSSTLDPSGFFQIDVQDTQKLLSTFSRAIEQNGRELFLDDDGLIGNLSSEDVKLICTLIWRADGNKKRRLPQFRFVTDSKSAAQFESGSHIGKKETGILVVTTDRAKKSRIEFIVENEKLDRIQVAAITGNVEVNTKVESIFISYTKVDENWARWVGSVLLSAGYKITVQYKDFLPGTNFVEQMDLAVRDTDRTIAILSPDYLKSDFATSEWQAAFRDDPLGHKRKLIPVRVAKVNITGLLGSVVYADIVGYPEKSATAILLGAISAGNHPTPSESDSKFPGESKGDKEYQLFFDRIPVEIERGCTVNASKRLQLATAIASLSTNQVNLLVFALNPPDNEIPPVSAPAKDRAAALLNWTSREQIDLATIESLITTLQD